MEEVKGILVKRGYNEELMQQQINKATNIEREELLTSWPKEAGKITPLVVTNHTDLPNLMCILHNHQSVTDVCPQLQGVLPKPPLLPTTATQTLGTF